MDCTAAMRFQMRSRAGHDVAVLTADVRGRAGGLVDVRGLRVVLHADGRHADVVVRQVARVVDRVVAVACPKFRLK